MRVGEIHMSNDVFSQTVGTFIQQNIWWIIAIYAWSLFWKGVALWKSAREGQSVWFVVFLFVNTIGILEILYIFYFSKHTGLPKGPTKDLET
jgi:hypothetical protein